MRGTEFPELWAVKRISRHLQNFPTKQYRTEIRNLRALSNVSFVQHFTLSQLELALLYAIHRRSCLTCQQHEWFVRFYSSYEDANFVYIAMEYLPMGDMSKTFANDYRWNESDAKVVVEQLLYGLGAMHNAGITHRDLKPEVSTPVPPKPLRPKSNSH